MSETKPLVRIETLSRRDVLRQIALGVTAAGAGTLAPAAAQEVHRHVSEEKKATGGYQPKAFEPHEYRAIVRLAELIVPADEGGGSALEAGAPEFIDLLCSQNEELKDIFTGGLGWLNARSRQAHKTPFVEAGEAQQIAMLDMLVAAEQAEMARRGEGTSYSQQGPYQEYLVYGIERPTDLGPGIRFFDWVRKLTVDAYYTSPIGFKDVGYLGNIGMPEYKVPQEAIDYALSRSPFKRG